MPCVPHAKLPSLLLPPCLSSTRTSRRKRRDLYEKTPLNVASYQIRMGKLEPAIETLEQGRALLWSEMHGLRTSTDQLRTADPDLAEKFTAINKKLEMLTTSTWLDEGLGVVDGRFECDKQMVQYPDLMARQQVLLMDSRCPYTADPGLARFREFFSATLLRCPSFCLVERTSHYYQSLQTGFGHPYCLP